MNKTPKTHLSVEQVNLLKIVCVMAWSDGEFSPEEQDLLLSYCSEIFAENEEQQTEVKQYLQWKITAKEPLPLLEELVAPLGLEEDRELALKLGYMVIYISQKKDTDVRINAQEKIAYRRLIELLKLPDDTVEKIEWAVHQELAHQDTPFALLKSWLLSVF